MTFYLIFMTHHEVFFHWWERASIGRLSESVSGSKNKKSYWNISARCFVLSEPQAASNWRVHCIPELKRKTLCFFFHYILWMVPEMSLSSLASFRYHHSADHDDPQQRGQDIATQSVLRHRHGPFRHRLLPVCLCCSDGVRNIKLLLLQHPETQLHGT